MRFFRNLDIVSEGFAGVVVACVLGGAIGLAVSSAASAQTGAEPLGGWTIQFIVAGALVAVIFLLLKRYDALIERKDEAHAKERAEVAETHGRRWKEAEEASKLEREQYLRSLGEQREIGNRQTELLRTSLHQDHVALQSEHREIIHGLANVGRNVLVLATAAILGKADNGKKTREELLSIAQEAVRSVHDRDPRK